MFSYVETDKFLSDHLVSKIVHQDCSAANALADGKMCRDPNAGPKLAQVPVYCYRTLGEISCYSTPDPYRDGIQQVESAPPAEPGSLVAGRPSGNRGD